MRATLGSETRGPALFGRTPRGGRGCLRAVCREPSLREAELGRCLPRARPSSARETRRSAGRPMTKTARRRLRDCRPRRRRRRQCRRAFLVPDSLARDTGLSQRRFVLLAAWTQHLVERPPVKFLFPPHDRDRERESGHCLSFHSPLVTHARAHLLGNGRRSSRTPSRRLSRWRGNPICMEQGVNAMGG